MVRAGLGYLNRPPVGVWAKVVDSRNLDVRSTIE